jgi:hypothetical protein
MDRSCRWQEVDVKMPNVPRRRRDLSPSFRKHPMNVPAGCRVIPEVPAEDFPGAPDRLQGAKPVVPPNPVCTKQVSPQTSLFYHHKRRVRFVPQVIVRQKIGKQLAILEHRINRVPQKPCVAADRPNCITIGRLIPPHLKVFKLGHGEQDSPQRDTVQGTKSEGGRKNEEV